MRRAEIAFTALRLEGFYAYFKEGANWEESYQISENPSFQPHLKG